MSEHDLYIKRCFELAEKGIGRVAPNPMVGCVIVCRGEIIGEGYHEEFGKGHAEVNAIYSVREKNRLQEATLYVNLEPCSHFGKTPPCADLIIESGIKKVVISNADPNPLVSGRGIKRLQEAGIEVISGVLENEGKFLNRRFFTFHEKKRPYIILKWAQTRDGFISKWPVPVSREENIISSSTAQWLVHVWRSHEMGIMVGTNTVLLDNPKLNVRLVEGKNPVKIILDRNMKVGSRHHVFNLGEEVILFTEKIYRDDYTGPRKPFAQYRHVTWIPVDFGEGLLDRVMAELHRRNISSVLVEGGKFTLEAMMKEGMFDEIRVLESEKNFNRGVAAPALDLSPGEIMKVGEDTLKVYYSPARSSSVSK